MKTLALLLVVLQSESLEELKNQFEKGKADKGRQREDLIRKIGALRTAEAGRFLEDVFRKNKDGYVRRCVVSALSECGAVPALLRIAKEEESWIASTALQCAANTPSRDRALKILRDRLKEASGFDRQAMMWALRAFPVEDTQDLWKKALSDPDSHWRSEALRKLAPLADEAVLKAAKEVLSEFQNPLHLRVAAYHAWTRAKGAEAIRILLEGARGQEELQTLLLHRLQKVKREDEIEAVLEGMKHASTAIRLVVARSLAGIDDERVDEALAAGLKDASTDVRSLCLEGLITRGSKAGEVELLRAARVTRTELSTLAIRGLAVYASKEATDFLRTLAGSRDLPRRCAALHALAERGDDRFFSLFAEAVRDHRWEIRAAGIRGLGRIRKKDSVDLLIERLPSEPGRLRGDIAEALRGLTAKSLGHTGNHWKDWWSVNRDRFTFPKASGGKGGARAGVTYFGLPVLSKRVLFCVDVSQSMNRQGRLTRLRQELKRVMTELDPDVRINFLFFNQGTRVWRKGLVPVGDHLADARKAVRRLKAKGTTNLSGALKKAFEAEEADTIFLLSDGQGRSRNGDLLLRRVREWNSWREVHLHTISVSPNPLLPRLAAQNGGRHSDRMK